MLKRNILIILFVLIICFIWGNSLLSAETSSRISNAVSELLTSFFGNGEGESAIDNTSVRKLAHFVEFFFLGIVASLLLRLLINDTRVGIALSGLLCLFIPVMDETIQIFSGRGPSLRDVWIDIGGYALGSLAVYLIVFIRAFLKKNNHKN